MKILFVSGLYHSPMLPTRSIGNARIVQKMRQFADVRVVVPLPYYPAKLAERRPDLRSVVSASAEELGTGGEPIFHPRHLHLPGFGRRFYGLLYGASLLPALREHVRAFQPDAVLSAWAYPDGAGMVLASKLLGLPSVVRVMGSDIFDTAQRPGRKGQIRLALSQASKVIAVSHHLGDEVVRLGVPSSNVTVIPTGVDPARFFRVPAESARAELGIASDRPVLLAPARLSPEKGLHFLLEALAIGVRSGFDGLLLLVGSGAEERRLKDDVARLGLERHVRFEGHQPESRMRLYFSAANVTCLPSTEEGWPDAVMESFACGTPLVASDVGGIGEIVRLVGQAFGRLVPPRDPPALWDAVGHFLSGSTDHQGLSASAHRHGIEETARAYVATCQEAAKRGR